MESGDLNAHLIIYGICKFVNDRKAGRILLFRFLHLHFLFQFFYAVCFTHFILKNDVEKNDENVWNVRMIERTADKNDHNSLKEAAADAIELKEMKLLEGLIKLTQRSN